MKTIAWLVAASVLAFVGSSHAEDNKTDTKLADSLKFVLDPLDQQFGIRMKSIVVREEEPPPAKRGSIAVTTVGEKPTAKTGIIITLDFTKDVTDERALRLLNDTFTASAGTVYSSEGRPLVFHVFDADNVCVGKGVPTQFEGDVSGVKGEAFRIYLSFPTETLKRAKRIETRLVIPARFRP